MRQDISIAQQLVQSNHASLTLGILRNDVGGKPNLVLIGIPDKKALHEAEKHLGDLAIDHVAWEEPDYDFGLTALATVPLTMEQKAPLSKYKLWQPICLGSLDIRASHPNGRAVENNHPEVPSPDHALIA